MAILDVQNLKMDFGSGDILREVSFSLDKGEVLSVIGSSGSGKTTLLRCLNFLEVPTAGRISVNGETLFDADDPATQLESDIRKKRQHFGLVFQSFNLFPQYTAKDNVMLARQLQAKELPEYRKSKKAILSEIEQQAEQLLAEVGLSDRMDFYPHQLSGGQQQRVAIARALALNPDILCFDEPTSALDPEISGEVLNAIRRLSSTRHITMIIVTHEMNFARDVSSHVIFLDKGVIAEEGSPDELFSNPKTERLRSFLSIVRQS